MTEPHTPGSPETTPHTLLHLDSSAGSAGESISRDLTARYAHIWRQRHGGSGYDHHDLVTDPVPAISRAYTALGRRVEGGAAVPISEVDSWVRGPAEAHQWALTLPLITRLLAADTVLIGAPMYNLSIPASLKAWIDRVSFPGAFIDPGSGASLLRGKRVVVITTRGGGYGPDMHQTGYLKAYFDKHGVPESDVHLISVDLTRAKDVPELAHLKETATESLAAARAAITSLAAWPLGTEVPAAI